MSEIIYEKNNHHNLLWATKRSRDNTQTTRESIPIDLSSKDRDDYKLLVDDAKKSVLDLKHSGRKDISSGIAALMSLRQKTGVLKASEVVEYTDYCLKDLGEQVVITTFFHNTTDVTAQLLENKKIDYAIIDGTMSAKEKEQARREFQTGDVSVVITSVTTGISLHANENSSTTSNSRRMIVADLQWSPSEHVQLEGRINRNGETGIITIPYLKDTVDEKVTKALLKGMTSQSLIHSDMDNANNIEVFAKVMGIELDL